MDNIKAFIINSIALLGSTKIRLPSRIIDRGAGESPILEFIDNRIFSIAAHAASVPAAHPLFGERNLNRLKKTGTKPISTPT